ncbi:hypothetical protein HDU67_004866, partial [Dinochytrium kinnereticum]
MILNTPITYPPDASQPFTDFLTCLLQKDPEDRIDWPDLARHPYLESSVGEEDETRPWTTDSGVDVVEKVLGGGGGGAGVLGFGKTGFPVIEGVESDGKKGKKEPKLVEETVFPVMEGVGRDGDERGKTTGEKEGDGVGKTEFPVIKGVGHEERGQEPKPPEGSVVLERSKSLTARRIRVPRRKVKALILDQDRLPSRSPMSEFGGVFQSSDVDTLEAVPVLEGGNKICEGLMDRVTEGVMDGTKDHADPQCSNSPPSEDKENPGSRKTANMGTPIITKGKKPGSKADEERR